MRYLILFMLLFLPATAMAAMDGIQHLNNVSTMKSDNANQDALQGASRQRDNIQQQKNLRAWQRSMERPAGSGMATGKRSHKPQLMQIAGEIDDIKRRLDAMGDLTQEDAMQIRMLQERMTKMQTMLSNMMKKASETQSGIISNMK